MTSSATEVYPNSKSPAFQFYPADFLSDVNVVAMSLQERGAYITLLCFCWIQGSLPQDVGRLARLCGVPFPQFRKLWPALEPCFRPAELTDRLRHPRLDREREKQSAYRLQQSERGKLGGRPRKAVGKPTVSEIQSQTKAADKAGGKQHVNPDESSSSSSSDFSHNAPNGAFTRADARLSERAGAFSEWYSDTHERLFQVGYMGTNLDYTKALELCKKFSDEQLRDGALVWFGMEDDFATQGTRTIPKFASRITGCLQVIKAKGLAS